MRCNGSDPDAVCDLDSLQLFDPADINQQHRRSQPQLQGWDQRMAAGDELAAVGVLLQQTDGLRERSCANVIE
jgi:hypothetical protein